MAVRDRIAVALLAAGVLGAMAVWQAWSAVPAIVVAAATLVLASVVYRVDWRRDRRRPDREPPASQDEVSTPRRVVSRP